MRQQEKKRWGWGLMVSSRADEPGQVRESIGVGQVRSLC